MSQGYGPMAYYGHSPKGETSEDHCEKCGAAPDTLEARTICPSADYIHIAVLEEEIGKLMSMGNIKSPNKIKKKIEQLYARQIRKNAELSAKRTARSFEDHLKPKPRWMPTWLYRKVMRVFLNF